MNAQSSTESKPPPTNDPEEQKKNLRIAWHVLIMWLFVGAGVIVAYSIKGPNEFDIFKALSTCTNGLLLACASVSVGVILGFLFGIPRTLQQERPADNNQSEYAQKVNTNLEQISDWLTKIIVGVGLTQLSKIPGKLQSLATYFGPSLGESGSFAVIIILNFAISGFVMGYILTRLFLAKAFYVADSDQDAKLKMLQIQLAAQAQISSENRESIKAVAYTVLQDNISDPLQADKQNDPATQTIMKAASEQVLNQSPSRRSAKDWLITAQAALQNGKYTDAVRSARQALDANPSKDLLWKIYNMLGLSYHYQQPDNWKQGDPEPWYQSSLEAYRFAIDNANSEVEKRISRANRAFLYLDTGRYAECESEVDDLLSQATQSDSSAFDLVRLVAAAVKIVLNKPAEAARLMNDIKNLSGLKYLFDGKDISSAIVTLWLGIPEIKDDYKNLLEQYKNSH